MTFVPSRYLYASQGGPFVKFTVIGGVAWAVLLVLITFRIAGDQKTLSLISLIYPLGYLLLSWVVTIKRGLR
jgi:hypothetical protein